MKTFIVKMNLTVGIAVRVAADDIYKALETAKAMDLKAMANNSTADFRTITDITDVTKELPRT